MNFKQNFDRLSRDVREYIDLEIEGVKLVAIEKLSLFLGDVLSWLAIMFFLAISFLAFLAAAVVALSSIMGYFTAFVLLACAVLLVAIVLFLLRRRLFVNIAVRRLCRMFFDENTDEE